MDTKTIQTGMRILGEGERGGRTDQVIDVSYILWKIDLQGKNRLSRLQWLYMILCKTRGKSASTRPFLWRRCSITWNVRKWVDDQALTAGTAAPLHQESSGPGKESMLWFWGHCLQSSNLTAIVVTRATKRKWLDRAEKKKKEYPGSLLGVAGHTKARLPQLVHYTQPIKSIPEMNSTSTGKIGRRLPVTAISRITSLRWAPPSLNHCPCWRIRWPNGWTCLPGVLQAPENCLLRKGSLSKHIRTGRPTLAHNYFYWLFLLFAL